MNCRNFIINSGLALGALMPLPGSLLLKNKPLPKVIIGIGTLGSTAVNRIASSSRTTKDKYIIIDEPDQGNVFGNKIEVFNYQKEFQGPYRKEFNIVLPEVCEKNWEYNRLCYASLYQIEGAITIIAGLGRETGTFATYGVLKELLRSNPASKIKVLCSIPWKIHGTHSVPLAHDYLKKIKRLGVETDVYDCQQFFQNTIQSQGHMVMSKLLRMMEEDFWGWVEERR